jgi:hypothetical protein
METKIKINKMTIQEIEFYNPIWKAKPKFAITKIVINDDNQVYAVNGSDVYTINFREDILKVINNTAGNQGWFIVSEETGNQHIKDVTDLLYIKDYIG